MKEKTKETLTQIVHDLQRMISREQFAPLRASSIALEIMECVADEREYWEDWNIE